MVQGCRLRVKGPPPAFTTLPAGNHAPQVSGIRGNTGSGFRDWGLTCGGPRLMGFSMSGGMMCTEFLSTALWSTKPRMMLHV